MSIARYFPAIARTLMGLIFLVTGLNGFLNFLPQPSNIPQGAIEFFGALFKTGYMIPLIMGTQVIVGVLLISNLFVPLALALIAPVVVNIFALHAFLYPTGFNIAALPILLEIYLAWVYRKSYRQMLAMRSKPD